MNICEDNKELSQSNMTAHTLSLDAFAMKILHRIAPGTQGRLHVSYGIMASFQTSEPFL